MSGMICERCETNEGTEHTFHYGRTVAPEEVVYHASAYLSDIGTHEAFQLSGSEGVVLCDDCLNKARRRRALRTLRAWVRRPLIAAAWAVLLIGAVAWAVAGDWTQAAICLGLGLAVGAIAFGVTYMALEDEDFAEHTAVDVHAERLREQGYDTFWTNDDLGHFIPH